LHAAPLIYVKKNNNKKSNDQRFLQYYIYKRLVMSTFRSTLVYRWPQI